MLGSIRDTLGSLRTAGVLEMGDLTEVGFDALCPDRQAKVCLSCTRQRRSVEWNRKLCSLWHTARA
jgi:hypothetical protein